MSADRSQALLAFALAGGAFFAHAQAPSANESPRLGDLTIGRLAAMQQQLLEQELIRKFSMAQPETMARTQAAGAGAAPAAVPPLAPPPPRTVTLLGLVAINGVVRHAELLFDGAVIAAQLGQALSGWRLAAVTPHEVRLVRGTASRVLQPGDSMEVR